MAVLLPSIQQAVFSLLMSFVGVAALYALAGADFLAITQIVVYVGGILVLLSFGILLTGRTALTLGPEEIRNRPLGVLLGALALRGPALGDREQLRLRAGLRHRRRHHQGDGAPAA